MNYRNKNIFEDNIRYGDDDSLHDSEEFKEITGWELDVNELFIDST